VALFEVRKLKTEGKLDEYEKALIGYKDKFMEQQIVYLELAAYYKEKGDAANRDLYLKKVDTLEHGGGSKCSDPSLLPMPGTLEILASLLELNPTSFRINHYIAQTYIAYGYPDLAIEYMDAHKDAYKGREPMNYWGKLASIAAMFCDLEGIDKLTTRCENLMGSKENTPDDKLARMNYRSSIVGSLYSLKRYDIAIARAEADLKKFETEIADAPHHPIYKKEGADPELPKLFMGVMAVMVTIMHHQYKAMSLIALGKPEGIYEPYEKMLKDAEALEFSETGPFAIQPWILRQRIYDSAAEVARTAKDEAKAEEFSKLSKAAEEKVREIKHNRRRK
jgi:hypothetical protein